MLKQILSFLFFNYLFWIPFIFADVTITSGVGDVNLPAGGGTATAASDVTRTGRVYGADGNGYWSLINSGAINSAGSKAIDFENSSGGSIINQGNGLISTGDDYGLYIIGDGIINNKDNAQILAEDRDAIYIGGNGTVTNNDNAVISTNNTVGIVIFAGTVVNNDYAVISADNNTAISISNMGTVINSGYAKISAGTLSISMDEGEILNTDNASIISENAGAIFFWREGTVRNSGNAVISAGTNTAISFSHSGTIINTDNAVISANDEYAIAISNDGSVINNGNATITSSHSSIFILGEGFISNSNNASILATNVGAISINSGMVINTDDAIISAANGYGIAFGANGTVINSDNGIISSGGLCGIYITGEGTVINRDNGLIRAESDYGIIIHNTANVINSGQILSEGNYGICLDGINTSDTLYNSGIIRGTPIAVDMGSGDDMVVLQVGSQIYGIMDGGADTDLLWLDGSGALNNEVQNFELLEKTGSGTWGINTDLSVYSTFVEQGSLEINLGGVLTTSDITIADNAELVIQGGTLNSDNLLLMDGAGFTYNGGDLNVSNFDSGILSSLNINSDFDCPEDLNVNGPVVLNSTFTCPSLTIFGNGSLSGNGTVNGSVVNDGILSPGNSIGILTVSGNYTQNNGAYNIETSPYGSCDKLYVSGYSVFNNTQLNVYTQPGHYYAHTVYDVVTSYSGLSGTFSMNAQNLTPLLYWGYRLDANKLSLEVMRRSYTEFSETPNQYAVAQALDSVEGRASGDFSTVLDVVDYFNEQGIAYALDSFSPASSDAFAAGALAGSYGFDDSIRNYLNNKVFFSDPKNGREGQTNVWANAISSKEKYDGEIGISGYEYTLKGMAAGADKRFQDDFLAGISAGVSDTDLNWTHNLNKGNTNSLHLGIYGQWKTEPLLFNAVVGFGNNTHEGKRFIEFADISRRAEIDYDSKDYSASLGASKNFIFSRFSLGIFDSLSYILLREKGYTESGADSLNLKISGRNSESIKNDLGFKASLPLRYKEISFIPNMEFSWVHEFKDEARDITGAFSDYPAETFSVSGLSREADFLEGQIGLSVLPIETLLLTVSYETALNDSDQSLSVWRMSASMGF